MLKNFRLMKKRLFNIYGEIIILILSQKNELNILMNISKVNKSAHFAHLF